MTLELAEIRNRAAHIPGGGIYTPRRVGSLAGVSGRHIGQWSRRGLITPHVHEGLPTNLYSYNDVAEALAVKWLVDQDFTFDQIRTAIRDARAGHPHWPLSEAPLGVAKQSRDDRGALVLQNSPGEYVETGTGGQVTLRPEFLALVKDVLRSGGWLAQAHNLRKIEVDPQTLGGLPRLRGRRWPVQEVALIAADSNGRNLLRREYGLTQREISESVVWSEAAAAL